LLILYPTTLREESQDALQKIWGRIKDMLVGVEKIAAEGDNQD